MSLCCKHLHCGSHVPVSGAVAKNLRKPLESGQIT